MESHLRRLRRIRTTVSYRVVPCQLGARYDLQNDLFLKGLHVLRLLLTSVWGLFYISPKP